MVARGQEVRSEVSAASVIVGISPHAARLRAEIQRIAPFRSTVLIAGPTGTGKELVARTLHDHSPRAGRAFIAVDCASVTGSLFASHLFGHRKGAFTGAEHESLGCFRAASGGTIFLDEVGELGLEFQSRLLRVLQERVVVPVGGHQEVPVDVRVIAATNRDLRGCVAAGLFREDLYYRLQVVSLTTTPLKDRCEDIPPLAAHLLNELSVRGGLPTRRLSAGAVRRLADYHWPGNVRQLKNVLERSVIFGHGDPLGEDVILEMLSGQPEYAGNGGIEGPEPERGASEPGPTSSSWPTAATVERAHLVKTLRHAGHNISAAARLLGWDRKHLRRKMEKYAIRMPPAEVGSDSATCPGQRTTRGDCAGSGPRDAVAGR